jgi:hypothetical protein
MVQLIRIPEGERQPTPEADPSSVTRGSIRSFASTSALNPFPHHPLAFRAAEEQHHWMGFDLERMLAGLRASDYLVESD